jgi:hypothetical protein
MRLAQEGDDAVIEVIDSGPGIPAAERERVFVPFYRISGSPGDGSGWGSPSHAKRRPAWAAPLALPRDPTARGLCSGIASDVVDGYRWHQPIGT